MIALCILAYIGLALLVGRFLGFNDTTPMHQSGEGR